MKNAALPIVILAIVLGAFSGGLAGSLSASHSDRTDAQTVYADAAVSDRLLNEIEALRKQNEHLQGRLALLEERRPAIKTAPFSDKELRNQVADLAKRIDGLAKRSIESAVPIDLESLKESPAMQATLEKALTSLRRKARAKGWRQGAEKRLAVMTDRIAQMRNDLNLSDHQVKQLQTAFNQQKVRDMAVIEAWESGNSTSANLGEMKRTHHQQHQDSLASILTPTQLEQLRAQRNGEDK